MRTGARAANTLQKRNKTSFFKLQTFGLHRRGNRSLRLFKHDILFVDSQLQVTFLHPLTASFILQPTGLWAAAPPTVG